MGGRVFRLASSLRLPLRLSASASKAPPKLRRHLRKSGVYETRFIARHENGLDLELPKRV